MKCKTNPTQSAVENLDGRMIGNYIITGKVYPVAFGEINELIEQDIETVEPDAVVSLGLASGMSSIHLERIAINTIDGREDNKGFKPNSEKSQENNADEIF